MKLTSLWCTHSFVPGTEEWTIEGKVIVGLYLTNFTVTPSFVILREKHQSLTENCCSKPPVRLHYFQRSLDVS
jgi:hypothetical protein